MASIEPATGRLTQTICPKGNSTTFIKHLIAVKKAYQDKSKITIVLDNASFHKSKEVKAWLAQNPKFELVYLPPYCPELNVVERYWKFMRRCVAHNIWVHSMRERKDLLKYWSAPFKAPNPTLKSLCVI